MIFWPRVAWGLGLCAGKVRANDPSRTPPLQRAGGQEMLPWLVVPPQVPPLVRPLAPPLAQPNHWRKCGNRRAANAVARWSVWRLFTLCIESLGLEANSPDPLHERGFHLYSQTGRLSRE